MQTDPEEYTCGDCDSVCEQSMDSFVNCTRCGWYLCRTCEIYGVSLGLGLG